MATVIYNGCGIIPAPLVSINDEPILLGNQERIGTTYRLTIQGTLISYKGSPASQPYAGGGASANWGGFNNQFWITSNYPGDETNNTQILNQLYRIESKQEALRNLFAKEGEWLEFASADGSAPLKAQIKNVQVVFEQGTWFTECPYTITAETDVLYLNGQVLNSNYAPDLVQNANEAWEIAPAEVIKTFNVSHTVSAVGKRIFTSAGSAETQPAWQTARDFVNTRLVLGWNGTSPYSSISGAAIFQQSSLGSGVLNFNGYKPYNFVRTENVDELAGSYSVTESWLAAPVMSGNHIYTVSTRRIVDDPYTTIVANIQGTIKGYYENLFDYDSRLAAASYLWSQLGAPTGLLPLVEQYNGDVYTTGAYAWNLQPRQGSVDYNYQEGSINYQYEFSNQLYHADAFEQYTVSRKTSANDYITTFGLAGSIKGRRYDGDTDVLASFNRAYTWFASLTGNAYNAFYQRVLGNTYFPEASGLNVQPYPISIGVDFNQAEGLISYTYEFNNRTNPNNTLSNSVKEDYTMSKRFSADEGLTYYTIQGTVEGLNITDVNPQQAKFAAATGYFYGVAEPDLYNRISSYYNVNLPYPVPFSTEVGEQPLMGIVTYDYQFRNKMAPILPNVLSEHITFQEKNYNYQQNTVGVIQIIGRSSPIIQDMFTTDVRTRTLNIETVISPPTGADMITLFNNKPDYTSYALQAKPANGYCTDWNDNYDPAFGHYSMSVTWIY